MFNTIILTIVALISVAYTSKLVRHSEETKKFDLTSLIVIILSMLILVQGRFYEEPKCDHVHMYELAYSDGYEQAIKDAILWDGDEYTYTISFNGELHTYANYYHE